MRRRGRGRAVCEMGVAIFLFRRGIHIRLWHERGIGFGVILGLTLLYPRVEFSRVCVDRGFFLVFVAMDGEVFGSLPALHGAHFAAEIRRDFSPGVEFFSWEG